MGNTTSDIVLKRGRGRPPGAPACIPPEEYRHDLVLAKINGDRKLNIRLLCKAMHISHMHFYRIMHGRCPASQQDLSTIEKHLALPALKIN